MSPFALLPPPSSDPQVVWELVGEHGPLFAGTTFGDGSGIHGFVPRTRRCGWGVVSAHIDENGIFTRTTQAFGNLHYRSQVVPLAELHAFLFYLQHVYPSESYEYVTDCSYVIDGFFAGRQQMCSGWSTHPSVWIQLFNVAEDLGIDSISLLKVAAHQKVHAGMTHDQRYHVLGNSFSDVLAKKGAAVHPHCPNTHKAIKHERAQVFAICRFLTTSALERAEDEPSPCKFERVPRQGSHLGLLEWKHGLHLPTLHRGRYRCSLCLASSVSPLPNSGCKADVVSLGHVVWALGSYLFCRRCSAYSRAHLSLLHRRCPGLPTSLHLRRAKLALLQGLDPVSGTHLGEPYPWPPKFFVPDSQWAAEDMSVLL